MWDSRSMHRIRSLGGVLTAWLTLPGIACHETTASDTPVHTRWYQAQSGSSRARPAVQGDLVYFGTGVGQVVARDRRTGALRWSANPGLGSVEGSTLVARRGVVVAPFIAHTAAFDASTGQLRWIYAAPPDTVGSGGQGAQPGQVALARLDSDSDAVYIPAWGASVSAVELATGSVRWIWQPGRAPTDTAAGGVFRSGAGGVRVSGDTVYATVWHYIIEPGGQSEAWLVALDRVTGRELWRYVVPRIGMGVMIEGSPAVYRNLVIFTTSGGFEWAVDRFTGGLAWQFHPDTHYGTEVQTELYDGVVYHDGADSQVYALRASDGTVLWKAPLSTGLTKDLLVTERRVLFTNSYRLYVVDRATGAQVAVTLQPHTSDSFFSSPAAYADGQVFVTVGDGAWSFDEP